MGRKHASILEDLGAKIVAGVDVDPEAMGFFADTFDAEIYGDHDELFEDTDVDALVVATPNRFHEAPAVAALEADKSVLIEKPLAHSLESARRIAAAAAASRGVCTVGFHNRYAGGARLFEREHEAGRFGTIRHVEANYIRRRGVPGAGSWFTDPALAGGGALLDIGVHALDLALFVLGDPVVTEVSGVTRMTPGSRAAESTAPHGDETDEGYVEDATTAFVRCEGGETITLEVAWATNRESATDLTIRGTKAGAKFDIGGSDVHIFDDPRTTLADASDGACDGQVATDGTGGTLDDVVLSSASTDAGTQKQDERFLSAVTGDNSAIADTVTAGLRVQQIIEAIYRSATTNRAIDPRTMNGTYQPVDSPSVEIQ